MYILARELDFIKSASDKLNNFDKENYFLILFIVNVFRYILANFDSNRKFQYQSHLDLDGTYWHLLKRKLSLAREDMLPSRTVVREKKKILKPYRATLHNNEDCLMIGGQLEVFM